MHGGSSAGSTQIQPSDHIKYRNEEQQSDGMKIVTGDSVLLGTMSFRLVADKFDMNGFGLEPDPTSSPTTGIKIYQYIKNYYEAESTFRFTDETASDDANLTDIVVSSGEKNVEPETYKEYDLDPEFDNQDPNEYTVTIKDYIDAVDVTATKSEEHATMKIKVPKHKDDGSLDYDGNDEDSIQYTETDLTSGDPFKVSLNKLGEPDTIITITVTAEDGTEKTYKVTIKRPYGIIEGNIITETTIGTTDTYNAEIRVYKSDDVSADGINWNDIISGTSTYEGVHDKLIQLESMNYKTNDDGTYKIYVIPGTYDILIDKPGYLDVIYKDREVQLEETEQLGEDDKLIAGDINKDGTIQVADLSMLMSIFAINNTDPQYEIKYDFNEDTEIQVADLSILMSNFTKEVTVN